MPETIAPSTPERALPHNLEAEKSVLGAILIHNEAFNHAAELIDSRDFFRDAHRRIFDKMVSLSERNDAIDFVTLKEELARSGELEEVGGPAYIASLADGVPRSANVEHYARIVKEKATLRNLIHSANRILSDAYRAEEDAEVILDGAEKAIFEIAEDRIREGFVPLRDLVQSSFATIEKLQQHKGLVTGVPTGFIDLDEMTSGLQPSDLVLVAARPSMGKTSFVLNIAQHVGTQTDMTVGFFSLEMSKEQLFMRLLTAEARIDAHRFRSGYLNEKDYGRLSHALGTLGQTELASISRSLKGLAKELRIPIVALSQLSRAPETRSDHRPQLSDLRESGALEQDADVVMFIFREEQYRDADGQPNQAAEGVAEIIIGKQRNGPVGTAKLAFIKEHTRFENLAQGAA